MPKFHTEQSRQKIRDARLLRKLKFGYINSPATREKIRIGNMGKKLSADTKRKISISRKGKKLKAETKKKIREAQLGEKNHYWVGGKKVYNCATCGKEFQQYEYQIRKHNIRHCSRSCSVLGSKHWNWKGGITPINQKIRTSLEYKLWRADIFERDEFTCQDCNQKGGKLNADHIKPFSVIITENHIKTFTQAKQCEELWDTDNGRTLCEKCHKNTDTYGTKANNHTPLFKMYHQNSRLEPK